MISGPNGDTKMGNELIEVRGQKLIATAIFGGLGIVYEFSGS